ncbi:MAG TPA: hypothetical protein VM735_06405, partial [Candidatus Kapabacteria bacterium]|nr:hypothetical protein [Candidatus Kapabacteria bacterium]
MNILRISGWAVLVSAFSITSLPDAATTNFWTKPSDGKWTESSAWSLGILPDNSQSVAILNDNPKTIEIDAATAQAFPSSLSMQHLVVSNGNTVLLNRLGADHPLTLNAGTNRWQGLELSGGARLVTFDSRIAINGSLRVLKGRLSQEGGTVTTDHAVFASGGFYYLTNGLFETADLELPSSGIIYQYGGTARALNTLRLISGSSYNMFDGELFVGGTLNVSDSSGFFQFGGLNQAGELLVASILSSVGYVLNSGTLLVSNAWISAGMSSSMFEQNGGVQIVTNAIHLRGSARYYPPQPIIASYEVGHYATVSARTLEADSSFGFWSYENHGQSHFKEDIRFFGSPDYPCDLIMRGGALTCSKFLVQDAVVDIQQFGGAMIVSNLFSFGGYYPGVYGGQHARPARYDFSQGTLSASHIDLSAEWVIGSSSETGRINNPGSFRMAGTLQVGNATELFGKFILASNATINLKDGDASLSFARSDSEIWKNSATLLVLNWDGNTNGGGKDQLRFGNNRNALTPKQVSQIQFIDPVNLPGGTY